MPETWMRTRWSDGSSVRCYSPSLVIEEYFVPGGEYAGEEFLALAREALTIGSDRVRAKFGFGCGHAMAQIEEIEEHVAQRPDARVLVEGFDREQVRS
jgi:uncharacterized repeat protein (TIGR04042 family)